jgi:replicative DNA helicase
MPADGSFPPAGTKPDSLPASVEAEQALLGAILYDNLAYERAGEAIRPEHFYEPFHARLFGAMEEHIRKGQLAEPIVIMERFRRDPAFEQLGGLRYLADLVDRAPPAHQAADYARIIRDLATRRNLIRLGAEIAAGAAEDDETAPSAMIEGAEAALYGLAERGSASTGPRTFADVSARAIELAAAAYDRDGGVSGLSTGLIDLDKMLGGLQPSDLIILAARPSMGKSGLAGNIALHAARRDAKVLLFSLEMSGEQFAMRLQAETSGVPSNKVRQGHIDASEFGRFRDAAVEIMSIPLFIDDTGGISVAQLGARSRRLKRSSGLDLVIVDYLQLATTAGGAGKPENRVQEVSQISMGLKALAKELNVPVLALSQLSRQVENREDKRPMLSDLRESGSIEQDADVVMFLYREAYYKSRSEPREGSPEHLAWQEDMARIGHVAELIIGKQRHGPIGTVRLHFNESLTKFSNLAREGRFEERPAYSEQAKPRPVFARDPSGDRA